MHTFTQLLLWIDVVNPWQTRCVIFFTQHEISHFFGILWFCLSCLWMIYAENIIKGDLAIYQKKQKQLYGTVCAGYAKVQWLLLRQRRRGSHMDATTGWTMCCCKITERLPAVPHWVHPFTWWDTSDSALHNAPVAVVSIMIHCDFVFKTISDILCTLWSCEYCFHTDKQQFSGVICQIYWLKQMHWLCFVVIQYIHVMKCSVLSVR